MLAVWTLLVKRRIGFDARALAFRVGRLGCQASGYTSKFPSSVQKGRPSPQPCAPCPCALQPRTAGKPRAELKVPTPADSVYGCVPSAARSARKLDQVLGYSSGPRPRGNTPGQSLIATFMGERHDIDILAVEGLKKLARAGLYIEAPRRAGTAPLGGRARRGQARPLAESATA